jgi:hypothetical protein
MGIGGTTNGFLINIFNKTGEAGIVIDIGREKENGTSKNINPLHHNRNRNWDGKDRLNMDGDLTSRNMNNGEGSNRDNPRFGNLKVNHKEDPRLNNHSSNPNNSVLNLRASDTREDNNTHSLKGNLKEGMQNIESRMTRSLKTLPSLISVG